MSLVINRENIYVMNPVNKYIDKSSDWNSFMENDFTIFIRCKVLSDKMMKGEHAYMFSRNGRHAGISTFIDERDYVHVIFNYWFSDENSMEKKVSYCIPMEEKNDFHEYIIIGDHNKKVMSFYVDNKLIGEIDYNGLEKNSYKDSYMWLGCGSMVSNINEDVNAGEYEYDLFITIDQKVDLNTLIDLKENYNEKYVKDYFDLPILNNETPHKNHIHFFLDFKNKTKYKIWNLSFNGQYPNLFIENNTIF